MDKHKWVVGQAHNNNYNKQQQLHIGRFFLSLLSRAETKWQAQRSESIKILRVFLSLITETRPVLLQYLVFFRLFFSIQVYIFTTLALYGL